MHAPIGMDDNFNSGGQQANIVGSGQAHADRGHGRNQARHRSGGVRAVSFPVVQHIGKKDEYDDPRKFENALSGIEHLRAFARPLGVSLLLENIPNDLSTPEKLKELIRLLRYEDLGVCFDVGHAHLMSSVHQTFGVLEDRVRSTHVHDNKRDKDSHLWPGDGTIDWEQTMQALRGAPKTPALVLRSKVEKAWMCRRGWSRPTASWRTLGLRRDKTARKFWELDLVAYGYDNDSAVHHYDRRNRQALMAGQ